MDGGDDDGEVTLPVALEDTARWRNVGRLKDARIAEETNNSVPGRRSPR